MNKTKSVKSQKIGYISTLIFSLVFGLSFFIAGLNLLTDPDATIIVNGVVEKANFQNSFIALLVGILSLGIFIFYGFRNHIGEVTADNVTIRNISKRKVFKWSEIQSAELTGFLNTYAIRFYIDSGKSYVLDMDHPKFKFYDIFKPKNAYYRTEMWVFFKSKLKNIE